MKLSLLLATLLLTASPALANRNETGGSLAKDDYLMTYNQSLNNGSLYSVSVVEPRSVRRNGYAVPSTFLFDCQKSEGNGYVAMEANRSDAFTKEVLTYYFLEFCTGFGYEYEDQEFQ